MINELDDSLHEVLMNIILKREDVSNGKLTKAFFSREDISDIKKELIKKTIIEQERNSTSGDAHSA